MTRKAILTVIMQTEF